MTDEDWATDDEFQLTDDARQLLSEWFPVLIERGYQITNPSDRQDAVGFLIAQQLSLLSADLTNALLMVAIVAYEFPDDGWPTDWREDTLE
jgi:hypothetical protein